MSRFIGLYGVLQALIYPSLFLNFGNSLAFHWTFTFSYYYTILKSSPTWQGKRLCKDCWSHKSCWPSGDVVSPTPFQRREPNNHKTGNKWVHKIIAISIKEIVISAWTSFLWSFSHLLRLSFMPLKPSFHIIRKCFHKSHSMLCVLTYLVLVG